MYTIIKDMLFCKYKDIFGEPGTGIHALRYFDIAVWDVVMTIIGAIAFSLQFRFNILPTMIGFFLFGIIMHRLFCVRTTIDKLLFIF